MDSDQVIEARLGCTIREYFDREGEVRFRDLEEGVIAELALNASGVLATGGGAVLREANRVQLRTTYHVIYLASSADSLYRRLRHDRKRPLLQVPDPLGRLRALFDERDPLYRATAHDVVETGAPALGALVDSIEARLIVSAQNRGY